MKMKRYLVALLAAMAWVTSAQAVQVLYTAAGIGPGGAPVAASALFDISGNILTITLKNTSGVNAFADVPGSTLTGLYWNFAGAPVLNPLSATVASGAIIGTCKLSATCATETNVSGEFGYAATSGPGGANNGIASSGYLTTGLPGDIGNFNGSLAGINLDGPASLDGINFGIISAAADYAPNGGLEAVPVIRDTVVFHLSGASGLLLTNLTNVSFQYGTALSELNISGTPGGGGGGTGDPIPEPGLPALVAIGFLGMAVMRGRRRHS
jgi:hypothetical protein